MDMLSRIEQRLDEADPQRDEVLTIEEAAEFLGLAKATLYSLVSRGELPSSKRGRRLYFSREKLSNWLLEGERTPATQGMRDHIEKMQAARKKRSEK